METFYQNLGINLQLNEMEIYLFYNDLQKLVNTEKKEQYPMLNIFVENFGIHETFPVTEEAWGSLEKMIKIEEDEKRQQKIIERMKNPTKRQRLMLRPETLYCKDKFFKGDYVKINDGSSTIYRIASFTRNDDGKLACNLITLYKKQDSSNLKYVVALTKDLILVKNSPLKFFSPNRKLYYKEHKKYKEGWTVVNAVVSEWGAKCDSITYQHKDKTLFTNVSVLEVIPLDERYCKRCHNPVLPEANDDCVECRWFICKCKVTGVCGCEELKGNADYSLSFSLSEQDIYLLRKDLKRVADNNCLTTYPMFSKLQDLFDVSKDKSTEYYPVPPVFQKTIPGTLYLPISKTKRKVEGFYIGDYVKVSSQSLELYRVCSFDEDDNGRIVLILVSLYKRHSPYFPIFEIRLPKEVSLVKKSPLRFFTKSFEVYNKTLKEEKWLVDSLLVSVWGAKFDSIVCSSSKGTFETLSIMDVVPNNKRDCWNCHKPVFPTGNDDCEECRWFKCKCIEEGACDCNRLKTKKTLTKNS